MISVGESDFFPLKLQQTKSFVGSLLKCELSVRERILLPMTAPVGFFIIHIFICVPRNQENPLISDIKFLLNKLNNLLTISLVLIAALKETHTVSWALDVTKLLYNFLVTDVTPHLCSAHKLV